MTTDQKMLVTATVPILKEHGVLLTTHFYKRLFSFNPEFKNIFNVGNQHSGRQQNALATAVLAYAEHIEDPSVLMPVLDRIGHKHISLDIRPEHYSIVGHHLLLSIKEVLGEAATEQIMDAWETAYNQLAGIMSAHEADLYKSQIMEHEGWTGWRPFLVREKVQESAEITSFVLYPADGGKIKKHTPGQYLSIKLFLPELNLIQARQYSISSSASQTHYRISVKKEKGSHPDSNGLISNRLHDHINEGDVVEITAPTGNFVLDAKGDFPVVLISGGVGLTPFISMLQNLVEEKSERKIFWLHACRNKEVHAFEEQVNTLVKENLNLEQHVFYSEAAAAGHPAGIKQGYLDVNAITGLLTDPAAQYYICGPGPFIQKQFQDLRTAGIDKTSIFFEEFGPQSLQFS
jgi:nitric oxide dioxygenase